MALDNMSTFTHNSREAARIAKDVEVYRETQAINRSKLDDILGQLQRSLAEALVCENSSALTLRVPIKNGKLGTFTVGVEKRSV